MTLSISIIRALHHPRALFFLWKVSRSPWKKSQTPCCLPSPAAFIYAPNPSCTKSHIAQNPILHEIPHCTTLWHPDQGPAGKFSGCLGWSTCASVRVHSISNVIGDFYKGFLGVHPIFRRNQPATLWPLSYLGTGRAPNSLLSTHFPY